MQIVSQTMGRQPGRGATNGYQSQRNAGAHGRSAQVNVHSSSNVFLAAPGQVRHDFMTDSNWPKQLAELLDEYGRTRKKNFKAKSSEKTLENRRNLLFKTFRMIMQDKGFTSLSQVKPRHVPRIVELWRKSGLSPRSMRNDYWHLGWYFQLFGMKLDPISEYANFPGEFTTTTAATRDLSWKGNGVEFDEVLKRVTECDPVAGRLLLAIKTFGLRVKEALCLTPHEAETVKGIKITKGSKTGRSRDMDFSKLGEHNFHEVLESLKGEVDPGVHLAWKNRTLRQAIDRLYYVFRICGVTRKDLGVTTHGLRHDFAIDTIEELTGASAPIRGGLMLNYRAFGQARRDLSEALGHWRPHATSAYIGSVKTMDRERYRRFIASWAKLESSMQDVLNILDDFGIENLYWIGTRSCGANTRYDAYEFVLPPGIEPDTAVEAAHQISESIGSGTGFECSVRAWEMLAPDIQNIYKTEAVPLVTGAKSPVQVMEERIAEKQEVRKELARVVRSGSSVPKD